MIEYKTVSLANQIYEKIEMDILTGVYEYGEILTESKLAENLGVSRTPIREALAKLLGDNLISETKKGVVVLGITLQDVKDMYMVKEALEVEATAKVAANISDEDLEKMKEIIYEQEFYMTKKDATKIRNLDTQFHELLYNNCNSPIVKSILSPLHRRLHKYRQSSLQDEERMAKSVEEHQKIYEALLERNEEKARKAAMEHIKNAGSNIKEK